MSIMRFWIIGLKPFWLAGILKRLKAQPRQFFLKLWIFKFHRYSRYSFEFRLGLSYKVLNFIFRVNFLNTTWKHNLLQKITSKHDNSVENTNQLRNFTLNLDTTNWWFEIDILFPTELTSYQINSEINSDLSKFIVKFPTDKRCF